MVPKLKWSGTRSSSAVLRMASIRSYESRAKMKSSACSILLGQSGRGLGSAIMYPLTSVGLWFWSLLKRDTP